MKRLTQVVFHDFFWSLHILLKNLLGTITHPYLTWKHLTREHYLPSVLMFFTAIAIFNFRAPLKSGLPDSAQTAFLTIITNLITSIGGYLIVTLLITSLARYFKSQVKFTLILQIWIYSYLPTVIWFLTTQSAYLLLPPPRTSSPLGIIFTIIYLAFSLSLLVWKLLLLWLTFQIPANLSPQQSFVSTLIVILTVACYWYLFFRQHLWGIPFL